MKAIATKIPGVIIIETDLFGDHRGYFTETYNKPKYETMGITTEFVQDNMSFSSQKGTLRGLHWQNPPHAQAKLVSCTKGSLIVRTINRSMFMDRPSLRESWLLAPHWTSTSLFVSLGYLA